MKGGVALKLLQNSGVPIYQQIAEQLKTDILAGKLKERSEERRVGKECM